MRKVLRRVLATVLVLLLVGVVTLLGLYRWQRPMLLTGTGYAAHNACAVAHVAGRGDPDADLPDNPLVPYLHTTVTDEGATSTLIGGLGRQQAWYLPGYGCVLALSRPDLPAPRPIEPGGNPFTNAATPVSTPEMQNAIDAAFSEPGTRAVLVVHDGQLVGERYADGFDKDTRQLGWSMAKSVASLMTGAVVQRGEVALDEDHLFNSWTDDRKHITVDDLLRMQSGLQWDETYELGTPITRMLYTEPDMGQFLTTLPLAHKPGTYQQYSSGSVNLLCQLLTDRTDLGPDLPRELIVDPLGLSSAVWEPDASGVPVCSSYLWATPRDWVQIGQFALDGGVHDGHQLLPDGWVEQTTRATPVEKTEDPGEAAGWWANQPAPKLGSTTPGPLVAPELPADTYFARGHDGQWLTIVPSQRTVILRMGFSSDLTPEEWYAAARGLLDAAGPPA